MTPWIWVLWFAPTAIAIVLAATALVVVSSNHQPTIAVHPLPWRIEHDWTFEVHDARGRIVQKFSSAAQAAAFIQLAEDVARGR